MENFIWIKDFPYPKQGNFSSLVAASFGRKPLQVNMLQPNTESPRISEQVGSVNRLNTTVSDPERQMHLWKSKMTAFYLSSLWHEMVFFKTSTLHAPQILQNQLF